LYGLVGIGDGVEKAASHCDAPSTGAGTDALSGRVIPGEEPSLLGCSAF
jgi:hypothetical protein